MVPKPWCKTWGWRPEAPQLHSRGPQAVTVVEEHLVEPVLDVILDKVGGSVLGVRQAEVVEQARERTGKLHGFGRCMWKRGFVGVVPYQVWSLRRQGLQSFFYGGQELEVLEVPDQAVGQEDQTLALNVLGELFAQEVSMIVGGLVAAVLEGHP